MTSAQLLTEAARSGRLAILAIAAGRDRAAWRFAQRAAHYARRTNFDGAW